VIECLVDAGQALIGLFLDDRIARALNPHVLRQALKSSVMICIRCRADLDECVVDANAFRLDQ
jgi:hypothetical protein